MKPAVWIKGKEYWYEDTPYYDPEKKQIRHTSRYLGKNISGVPAKVRTEGILDPCIASMPTAAYTHANLLPLQGIIKELRIDEYLAGLAHEQVVDNTVLDVFFIVVKLAGSSSSFLRHRRTSAARCRRTVLRLNLISRAIWLIFSPWLFTIAHQEKVPHLQHCRRPQACA
jgi:hypothetical protein